MRRSFGIRDILWLTTLAAVVAAWFADHFRQEYRLRRERATNVEAATRVQVEWLRRYRGEIPSTEVP